MNPDGPARSPPFPGQDCHSRLLFVGYLAFVENQFEFLMIDRANSTVNPRSYPRDDGEHPAGHDPLIGQQAKGSRERMFTLRVDEQTFEPVNLPREWVISTGGGYFFAPSITALKTVLSV
jgi:hypothetical protein